MPGSAFTIYALLHCLTLCPWHCAHLLIRTIYPDFVLHRPTISSQRWQSWCLVFSQLLSNIGSSRLWVPLLGTISHLKSALFHGICPVRFTRSLKLLFSPAPGLGAPLSSYLEVAL